MVSSGHSSRQEENEGREARTAAPEQATSEDRSEGLPYLDNRVQSGSLSKPRFLPSEIDARLDRLKRLKTRSQEFADYVASHHADDAFRAHKIYDCGTWLQFRHYLESGENKLAKANYCQQRHWCQFCSASSAIRTVHKYHPKIAKAVGQTGDVPYMLTLTTRNLESLDEMMELVLGSWSKWVARRRNALKGLCRCALAAASGGVASFETKRGANSGLWHFHAHVLLLLPRDVDYESTMWGLQGEWSEFVGHRASVDLREIRCGDDGLISGCMEVFKYALKTSDLDPVHQYSACRSLHRKRLLRSFGALRGVKTADAGADELPASNDYLELLFRWNGSGYQHFETKEGQK